jgi:NADH-quinone oxidoreductase subunit J
VWVGPSLLALVLLAAMVILLVKGSITDMNISAVPLKNVSLSLYGKYIIAVELVGFLLMAGIVGAAHIGKHKKRYLHRFLQNGNGNINAKEMNVEKEEAFTNK